MAPVLPASVQLTLCAFQESVSPLLFGPQPFSLIKHTRLWGEMHVLFIKKKKSSKCQDKRTLDLCPNHPLKQNIASSLNKSFEIINKTFNMKSLQC